MTELSHEERESIIRVLKRDAELNDLESERVFRLKRILKDFKRRGIGKDRISMKWNDVGKICAFIYQKIQKNLY